MTIPGFPESLVATEEGIVEPAGAVGEPTIAGLPDGYRYGVTRYADLILKEAFPDHVGQLSQVLADFRPARSELVSGGGNKASFTRRFDEALRAHGWGKRNIEIGKTVDGSTISRVRGHEIDMFLAGPTGGGWPGIAVEMEWNNKDPFFDRTCSTFRRCTARACWRSASSSRGAPPCRSASSCSPRNTASPRPTGASSSPA